MTDIEHRAEAYRAAMDLYFDLANRWLLKEKGSHEPSLDDAETNVRTLADWLLKPEYGHDAKPKVSAEELPAFMRT